MAYLAGLDVSMEETHICVLDRDGTLIREGEAIREGKARSSPDAINDFPAASPTCTAVAFETGRMAPMPYHGLAERGIPTERIEGRQACQALRSLAGHKSDRNDARGLAHLARRGFYKPTHVKSLSAHAIRSLIAARKKPVGQRVTIDNQIRGPVVVFGVRLPRALSSAFKDAAMKVSDGVPGLHAALRGLFAAREAILSAVSAIDADIEKMARKSRTCARLMTVPGAGPNTALALATAIDDPARFRRSRDVGPVSGACPRATSARRDCLHRQHFEAR